MSRDLMEVLNAALDNTTEYMDDRKFDSQDEAIETALLHFKWEVYRRLK